MAEMEITVSRVAAFEPADGRLRLEDGTTCTIDRQNAGFEVWARLVQKSQQHRWHLYVACDRSSRQLTSMLPAAVHHVESVAADPSGGGLRVRFRRSHAIHVLKTSRDNAAELRPVIEQAATSGEPVLVTISPRDMEIIDARPAPAEEPPPPNTPN